MKITETEKCFGCGACQQICPKQAITMAADCEGFLRPEVKEELCVQCGLCQKACPAESITLYTGKKTAYALKHKEEAKRKKATSGGAFIALSDVVLKEGGAVYGVVYNEEWKAVHTRTTSRRDRYAMCGSKYVQSDCGDTFAQAAEDLKQGMTVLYTGTNCQIDGLKHYLALKKVPVEKLFTVGLICHGTPSPLMWQEHLQNIRNKRHKEIAQYAHRSKVRGWHEHNEHITFADGKQEYYSKLSQNHKDLFYGHFIIRPSCSVCPYAPDPSTADITIADFWGCQYIKPEIDDNKGVSLVLVNSTQGQALLDRCDNVDLWETDYTEALNHNHTKPCKPHPRRAEFWEDYHQHGYEYVCAKYVQDNFKDRLLYGGKKRLRAILVKLKLKPL